MYLRNSHAACLLVDSQELRVANRDDTNATSKGRIQQDSIILIMPFEVLPILLEGNVFWWTICNYHVSHYLIISGEARRKWMVVPITDLQTLKIYPKGQLDNCNFDRNGKVLLL